MIVKDSNGNFINRIESFDNIVIEEYNCNENNKRLGLRMFREDCPLCSLRYQSGMKAVRTAKAITGITFALAVCLLIAVWTLGWQEVKSPPTTKQRPTGTEIQTEVSWKFLCWEMSPHRTETTSTKMADRNHGDIRNEGNHQRRLFGGERAVYND